MIKRPFNQSFFKEFLRFFQWWDYIFCTGRIFQKGKSVCGRGFLLEWLTGLWQKIENWLAWGPSLLNPLGRERGWKQNLNHSTCFLISWRNKEHSIVPSQPVSLYNSCLFQNRTLHAPIVQHACMGWGHRNRSGVQFSLEMCLMGLASFTSAPAVIALVANKSYSEDWRKFWFCVQLRGLIALQNIMPCTNTQE